MPRSAGWITSCDLGIGFVELLPVNAFNGTHNWGYDGVLWYAVHEGYGGPAAYQRFVDECHLRGIGVIQDVVYNHLGPSGNYLPEFGPYLRDAERNTWGLIGGSRRAGGAPVHRRERADVDARLPRRRSAAGRRACPQGLVGRVTSCRSSPRQTDALSAHLGRPLTLIAESDLNDATLISAREAGGYGLTAQWSDDYHHALHVAVSRGDDRLLRRLRPARRPWRRSRPRGFFHDGTWSSFRGRTHGHPIDPRIPTSRLVTFSQDHDQIGNRAAGDRLSQTLDEGGLAIAAVLTVLSPFTPDAVHGRGVGGIDAVAVLHVSPRAGARRRRPPRAASRSSPRMGWDRSLVPDPQDPETFSRSKLRWDERRTVCTRGSSRSTAT